MKRPFSPWLESDDALVVANSMIVLIQRTMSMLGAQLRQLGGAFVDQGGFRERMYQCRTEVRDAQLAPNAPACPECGKPMQQRISRTGKRAGQAFWGCLGYPNCRGTRQIDDSETQ